jgi:hypothetical protein
MNLYLVGLLFGYTRYLIKNGIIKIEYDLIGIQKIENKYK